jgi:hypothetical protein
MIFPILLLIAIPLALYISAVILRSAIGFANRKIGPPAEPADYQVVDEDDWGDYPLPGDKQRTGEAIPVPGMSGGMLMMVAVLIVNAIVTFAVHLVVIGDGPARHRRGFVADKELIARFLSFGIGYFVMSGLLAAMLPTTYRRGCLVAGYYVVICLGIAAIFLVPMVLLGWR